MSECMDLYSAYLLRTSNGWIWSVARLTWQDMVIRMAALVKYRGMFANVMKKMRI